MGLGKESFIKKMGLNTFLRETARVMNMEVHVELEVMIGNLATYLIG